MGTKRMKRMNLLSVIKSLHFKAENLNPRNKSELKRRKRRTWSPRTDSDEDGAPVARLPADASVSSECRKKKKKKKKKKKEEEVKKRKEDKEKKKEDKEKNKNKKNKKKNKNKNKKNKNKKNKNKKEKKKKKEEEQFPYLPREAPSVAASGKAIGGARGGRGSSPRRVHPESRSARGRPRAALARPPWPNACARSTRIAFHFEEFVSRLKLNGAPLAHVSPSVIFQDGARCQLVHLFIPVSSRGEEKHSGDTRSGARYERGLASFSVDRELLLHAL
ncbi:hypothetical protein EYF80_019699 [Liparis tanakae]|uniref:Uncharacterized protein n=1 Tax=Liparis tanakae TaxID=230148 RepID=A0A4Z2HYH3_9TELE|nr:hypothetical protein EYF80_019699 [Liparis tanakae]